MNGHNELDHGKRFAANGSQPTAHESRFTAHDEINLLDYWRVVKKYRKMIIAILAATSVATIVITLLMQKSFKAEALIIPISSKGSGGGLSAMTSQFGGLASLAGISMPGGAGETEKIMAILKSRTLTENVINRENLMPVLFEKAWDAKAGKWKYDDPKKQPNMEVAVKRMKSAVTIMDDKKGKTIKISGVFKSPELVARVVNAYIDGLQNFISSNAFTMAKRNRIFIEGQLEENKEELLEAGKEINEFYQGNRISSADARVDVPLNREPRTVNREPLPDNQVALPTASLESNTTNNGSPLTVDDTSHESPFDSAQGRRVTSNGNSELTGLISQKTDLEKKITEAKIVKNVPQQVYLTYLMLRRELLAKVNALLTSQYEMAKIEESKEDLAFQVIDKAVPPVKKFKPKRAQICMMSFMAALFGAIFIAFFREYINRMKTISREP